MLASIAETIGENGERIQIAIINDVFKLMQLTIAFLVTQIRIISSSTKYVH
jgi:hypothetical protein